MSLWRPTLALVFWVVYCPLGLRAATTIIQSTDPAIDYIGVWEPVRANSTTAYVVSNTTGSKAVYTFAGTRISVFGVVLPRDSPSAAQVSEYSVDGGTPTQYTAPGGATGPVYNLQFYSSALLPEGQHTLTILNRGDEFIIARLEVTTDAQHIGSPSSSPSAAATVSESQGPSTTSAPSSTHSSTSFLSTSTTQSTSSQTASTNNGTLTSTNATSTIPISSTLPPTMFTSTSSSTSILPTSSSDPPDSTPRQDRATTLSKGATIGGGIAGTLGFLSLVGGVCWWGQRRGRRKRHGSSGSASNAYDTKPPLGMHAATSQVTLGSDPFAPDRDAARLRRGPPLYIPVRSASDLVVGGTQYTPTPTQELTQAGRAAYAYPSESKYGTDDAPLRSPSTSNLLGSPTHQTFASPTRTHQTFASPAPRLETPVAVRRMDPDGRRRSADGGVRIAGGRPGQRVEDADTDDSFLDMASRKSIGSTLPPAYDFD